MDFCSAYNANVLHRWVVADSRWHARQKSRTTLPTLFKYLSTQQHMWHYLMLVGTVESSKSLVKGSQQGWWYIRGFLWHCGPMRAMASSFLRFLDYTQQCITVGRTPLDEWSVHRRDRYLTKHNTHNRQTSMSSVGFEPTISAGERQ